jgi:hypothetical protein
VRPLKEIGIPELSDDQLQALAELAENTARDYIYTRISRREISNLEITVESLGPKPITVTIEVELDPKPSTKKHDAERLTREATQEAFDAVEHYLEELKCQSTT